MAIFKTTFTNKSKIDRLLQIVNSTFFLAIAKSTAWDTTWGDNISDSNPPAPLNSITDTPEILFYKKPFYQTLAVSSQCGVTDLSCGESLGDVKYTLLNLETTTLDQLYTIVPTIIYFRIDILQSDLTALGVNSFRIASLYKDITFQNGGFIRYLPSDVISQGTLYWTSYFTPIQKDALLNKTSTFEILLKI